jgi:hypothetical protein
MYQKVPIVNGSNKKLKRLTGHGKKLKLSPDAGGSVIPATQEAQIRRISVQKQPRTNSSKDPSRKYTSQKKGLA